MWYHYIPTPTHIMSTLQFSGKIAILLGIALGIFVFWTHSQQKEEMRRLSGALAGVESRLTALESASQWRRSVSGRKQHDTHGVAEGSRENLAGGVSGGQSDATAALQQQVDEMRRVLAERRLIPPDQQSIDAAKVRVLDAGSSSMEKLEALRLLRSADARSDDVVLAMIAVYDNESDPRIRADVFRQLDGVNTPELREPLLHAVSEEEVPDVREEAAETLAHFLPDENVREWLEYLRDNDPDEDVREQAGRSLSFDGNRR